MNFTLENYWYILLLLVLPIMLIMLFRFLKWKSKKRSLFATKPFQEGLFTKSTWFSKSIPVLYFLAFLFLIFSIIDLLSGNETIKNKQKMNNVIFLLDVSNSMNAEDVNPNRLTEAKNILINTLDKVQNDKVGIVVFAGEARSIMPLTSDFTAAQTYLNVIETSAIQEQGTDFLKAIKACVEKFGTVPKGAREIVMISDGEDNEDTEAKTIRLANNEGIRIITVGVGTEQGAPVPEYDFGQLMGYKIDPTTGETVISKRETNALKSLAEKTNGVYIDGNNLSSATDEVALALKNSKSSTSSFVNSTNYVHYYQYFLVVSVFFFFIIYLFNPKGDLNL